MVGAALVAVVAVAAPLKLATVGFTEVGLPVGQGSFFAEHFATKLAEDDGVRVVTPKDMAAVIGVEKQKALLGCSDSSASCMAELAGALGADGLVTGQIAKVGKSFQVNVKIIAGDGSRTLFVHSSKLLATEEDVIEELNAVAVKATRRVREVLGLAVPVAGPAPEVSTTPSSSGRSALRLLPGILGVGAVVAGVIELVLAGGAYGELTDTTKWPTLTVTQAQLDRDGGKTSVELGSLLLGVGVAIIVGTIIFYLAGGS
jgi:hypothetical protein